MAKKKSTRPGVFTIASAQYLSDLKGAKEKMSAQMLQSAPAAAFRATAASAASTAPENNVVGVGIGEKISDGKNTGVMAVKFLVRVKYSPSEIDKKHQLPKTVNGLPTDVEQVGTFRKVGSAPAPLPMPNPKQRFRPAQPGCSVGFREPSDAFVMAGTFGALAKNKDGLFILSNNHVLADENQLPIGSSIFQPGLLDGGKKASDQIARLSKFVRMKTSSMNKVDCAIAKAIKKSLVSNSILFIGPPQGTTPALMDMIVHKFGRTTSYRVGRITSINTDVSVQYDTGLFKFGGQIIIKGLNDQPFSASGDSGSLILERATNKAIGLLFAGSATHTIANHIKDVLTALNVTLA